MKWTQGVGLDAPLNAMTPCAARASRTSGRWVETADFTLKWTPPAPLIDLHQTASREVLAAVGINPALFSAGDGTAAREAWRQLLFGVVAPLGRIVQEELQAKLEADVKLGWEELRASDLSGRGRAFQSMVGGGMEVEKAAALAGLMDAQ